MGEAKRKGKDRIELAKRRQAAIENRIAKFSREVGEYGKKTGLDLGAVKLDARFVIMKFDDLVKFVERLPMSGAEILEDLEQRLDETPDRDPRVAWWRRWFRRVNK